ncbi:hypothetical protein PISMIDRAFT_282590 [Pisolithus microcarpus 441]|uniref:Uncharacterized protein n=1 Tax=Pisolithus microcarpus 441 TaxID=765257 RepID=A0A0C9Z0X6_9AGAM|nr:hypothetical protein PISMIDRAFT_282590 [Pisolithus microcarpus 441]
MDDVSTICTGVLVPPCLISPLNVLALLYDPTYDNWTSGPRNIHSISRKPSRSVSAQLALRRSLLLAAQGNGNKRYLGCVTQLARRQDSMDNEALPCLASLLDVLDLLYDPEHDNES